RLLARHDAGRHRSAADPAELAAPFERLKVAANRHGRDVESRRQIGYAHEAALLHQARDPFLAELGRNVGVYELPRIEAHGLSLTGRIRWGAAQSSPSRRPPVRCMSTSDLPSRRDR